jgi:predicted acylesterase/phospholipase RssA
MHHGGFVKHVDAVVGTGGGSRGSWQAGAALGSVEHLPDDFKPTIFRGTSTGAIGVAGWAAKPTFEEGCQHVVDSYHEHVRKTSDIWQWRWPLGIPALWNPSVGTNDQLKSLLDKIVDQEGLAREAHDVQVAAVDVLTGALLYLPLGNSLEETVTNMLASSSFPMAFPPVEVGDHWCTDGGIRDIAPLGHAIKAGATRILMLGTNDPNMLQQVDRKKTSDIISFGFRMLDLQSNEILKNDLARCDDRNRLARVPRVLESLGVHPDLIDAAVAKLNITEREVQVWTVLPSKPLGPPLDFSGALMDAQIEQGIADAKLALGA